MQEYDTDDHTKTRLYQNCVASCWGANDCWQPAEGET